MIIHSVIAGFTQDKSRWNGASELSEKLNHDHVIGIDNRVWLHEWNARWKMWADHVWHLSEQLNERVEVCIHAYSWGGGWGAMQFAKHLKENGIHIPFMCLCDAVYRHWYPLGNWRAYSNWWNPDWYAITVPSNVGCVHWFRQTIDFPRGHNLIVENTNKTLIHPPVILDYGHRRMDDSEEWHKKSIDLARHVSGRPGSA